MIINTQYLANSANFKSGRTEKIEYIVVHYTANNGDTASSNARYFANNTVETSAHFFVDENYIFSSVPEGDTAWHCGGGLQGKDGHSFYEKCTNSNSVGVELCSRLNGDTYYFEENTVKNAAGLVLQLMKKYNISQDKVIRHYDVTGKLCPKPFIDEGKWAEFKQLLGGEEMSEQEKVEFEALKQQVEKLENEQERVYHYVAELPDYAKATIEKLLSKKIFCGESDAELNLPESMMRVLIINDRAGLYK